jgi:hypothetical protein
VPSFIFDFFAKLGSGSADAPFFFYVASAADALAETRASAARPTDAFLRK